MEKNQRISLFLTAAILLCVGYFIFGDELTDKIKDKIEGIALQKETVADKEKPEPKTSSKNKNIGKVLDSHEGVKVFNNGRVANVSGRNTTSDGYNLGLKYQCVEFVKRFYYNVYNHKMPNSYGHAKEFYDQSINDGGYNVERALKQYSNPSRFKPTKNALVVYGPTPFNGFGHVAIISKVTNNTVETISQNLGAGNGTRRTYELIKDAQGNYRINEQYVLGWLSIK